MDELDDNQLLALLIPDEVVSRVASPDAWAAD